MASKPWTRPRPDDRPISFFGLGTALVLAAVICAAVLFVGQGSVSASETEACFSNGELTYDLDACAGSSAMSAAAALRHRVADDADEFISAQAGR